MARHKATRYPTRNIEYRKPQWPNTHRLLHRIVGVLKQWSGGKGDKGAIPFATACGMYFFELGVGQSTVMRVPAVVPVTSNIGVPVPKTLVGPKSLK